MKTSWGKSPPSLRKCCCPSGGCDGDQGQLCGVCQPPGAALQSWEPEAVPRFMLGGQAKRFWEEAGDSEPAGCTPARGPGRLASAFRLFSPHWGLAGLGHCRPRSRVCTASSAGAYGGRPGVAPTVHSSPCLGTLSAPGLSSLWLRDVLCNFLGGRVRASLPTVNGGETVCVAAEGSVLAQERPEARLTLSGAAGPLCCSRSLFRGDLGHAFWRRSFF